MAKKTNLLIWGAVAVGGYFLYRSFSGGKKIFTEGEKLEAGELPAEGLPEGPDEGEGKPTATITASSPGKITQAINQAKEILKTVKDGSVQVKTPKGKLTFRKGKKKKGKAKLVAQAIKRRKAGKKLTKKQEAEQKKFVSNVAKAFVGIK